MSTPFVGEIRIVAFTYAPVSWAVCDGSLLAIGQYTALFSVIGTQYGGNGTSNFQLPDFRSRVGIGAGSNPALSSYVNGEEVGEEAHTLSQDEIPAHNHAFACASATGTTNDPGQAFYAEPAVPPRQGLQYGTSSDSKSNFVLRAGGNGPHDNIQPYQSLLYVIALNGIFPSRP